MGEERGEGGGTYSAVDFGAEGGFGVGGGGGGEGFGGRVKGDVGEGEAGGALKSGEEE